MGWGVVTVMDSRTRVVLAALSKGANLSALCREEHISRRILYKWMQRFKEEGATGLEDRPRGPRPQPPDIEVPVLLELARLRELHPSWGADKLRVLLGKAFPGLSLPSSRTLHRALKLMGKVRPRRNRRPGQLRLEQEMPPLAPNDVWSVDFKGWWHVRDGKRCDPFTLRDEFSRYVLAVKALPSLKGEGVQDVMEAVFEQHGLPQVIHSDNGRPFAASNGLCGLTKLSAWWLALGIDVDRSRPHHPQDNGAHERMHLDIRNELEVDPAWDLALQQDAFDHWRLVFNTIRPHAALGMQTPGEVYRTSPRPYPGRHPDVVYPPHMDVRPVRRRGTIRYLNRERYVTEALHGWSVGLERTTAGRLRLWFGNVCLGETDERFGSPLRPAAYASSQSAGPGSPGEQV